MQKRKKQRCFCFYDTAVCGIRKHIDRIVHGRCGFPKVGIYGVDAKCALKQEKKNHTKLTYHCDSVENSV